METGNKSVVSKIIRILTAAVIISPASMLYSNGNGSDPEGWIFDVSGYYKNIIMYQERDEFSGDIYSTPERKKLISDLNRLRISPDLSYNEIIILSADIDLESLTTNYYNSDEFDYRWRETAYNDFADLTWTAADNKHVYGTAEFQNLYVKLSAGAFALTAGRQQIRFGSSRLWNPLDLMNPVSPLSIEGAGEITGTDAVRVDWFPSGSTELAVIAAPRREKNSYEEMDLRSGNYIARFKAGVSETDIALLTGYTSRRKNYGADFSAVLFDGLFTGVILFSVPDSGEAYYQCGSGYEYTFSPGIYFLVEYFYNSLPVNDDERLKTALARFISDGASEDNIYILSNRMITSNRHYLSVSAGYDFFPLLRGELFSIYDFQGRGLFFNASIRFNALENLDITAGVITAYVSENGRISDFDVYHMEPELYAALQFYY